MADIEVVKIKTVDKGNLKAFAAVRLGGVEIRDCRIVQHSLDRAHGYLCRRSHGTRTVKTDIRPWLIYLTTSKEEFRMSC